MAKETFGINLADRLTEFRSASTPNKKRPARKSTAKKTRKSTAKKTGKSTKKS